LSAPKELIFDRSFVRVIERAICEKAAGSCKPAAFCSLISPRYFAALPGRFTSH
jgi:hypothetical protein